MRSRLFHWLVFVCVVCVLVCPHGRVLAQQEISWDEPDPFADHVRIESMSLSVKVRGRLATTTMDLVFANTGIDDTEGILQWRMAPNAVVHDLVLWVEGLRIPCEVCPRISARATHDRIVAAKIDPAIVEYAGDGVWNLSVFPVVRGTTRKVRVVYSQMLSNSNYMLYAAPRVTSTSPCRRIGKFEFEAEIACPGGVKDFLASRDMGLCRKGRTATNPGGLVAGFRTDEYADGKSVWFYYISAKPLPRVLSAPAEMDPDRQPGESRVHICEPNSPESLSSQTVKARNVVLVLDASGSMAGEPWKTATAAAKKVLGNLTEHDRFNVVVCGPEPKLWKDDLLPPTPANRDDVKAMIAKTVPAGGTDLAGALRAATKFTKKGQPAEVFVISDGWDQVAAEYSTAKSRPKDPNRARRTSPPCRILALGIAGRNRGLEELARSSGGLAAFVTDASAIEQATDLLIKQMRLTYVRELTVRRTDATDDGSAMVFARHADSWPQTVGWTTETPDEAAKCKYTISAMVNGRRATVDCDVASLAEYDPNSLTSEDEEIIRRIHAHLTCQTRYPLIEKPGSTAEDLAEFLGLCRRRHIASSGSALLVLEWDVRYANLGIDRSPTVLRKHNDLLTEEKMAGPDEKDPGRLKQEKRFEKELRSELDALQAEGKLLEAQEKCETSISAWDQRPGFRLYLTAVREFLRIQIQRRHRNRLEREMRRVRLSAWHKAPADYAPPQSVPTAARFAVDVTPEMTPAQQDKLAGLTAETPMVVFTNRELQGVFWHLEENTKLDIKVSWSALRAAGVARDGKLTVAVEEGLARDTLKAVLSAVKSKVPLAFKADGGSVIVTTEPELPRVPLLRFYDLRPILCGLPCHRFRSEWDPFSYLHGEAGGGIFGDGSIYTDSVGAGIFGDSEPGGFGGSWGESGPDSDQVTLQASRGEAYEPGSALEVSFREGMDAPFIRQIGQAGRHSKYYEPYRREPSELAKVFPDRGRVAAKIIDRILDTQTDNPNRASRDVDCWYITSGGTVAVRNSPVMHKRIARTIRQLNEQTRNGKLTDAYLPHWPESIFTWQATIEKWTAGLLEKARAGTLSEFSSARIENLPGRRMVRIGGIWFDATLTTDARIYTVARTSPAGLAVKKALGASDKCFSLIGPVIIPAGGDMAVCLDRVGIRDENDPDLKRLLAALKAEPTTRPEPSTKPAKPAR